MCFSVYQSGRMGRAGFCSPYRPGITRTVGCSCRRSFFFFFFLTMVYLTHLFVNKAHGMMVCNLVARSRCFQQVRKKPTILFCSLRLRSRVYRLHTKLGENKEKGKAEIPGWYQMISPLFLDKTLRSCENNISCKGPKTTQIIVVMACPCRLPQPCPASRVKLRA